MRVHEYQAKSLLSQHGIPVPRGQVASGPDEAAHICSRLGGEAVIKAQVHAGGRGKAGGIRVTHSPAEARAAARDLLGSRLATAQTRPEGLPVGKLLVEELVKSRHEGYLGIAVDEVERCPVVIASPAGGTDIEELAGRGPHRVKKMPADPVAGLPPEGLRQLAGWMALGESLLETGAAVISSLLRLFTDEDCLLAEINPLAVTTDGKLLALDARLLLDDNALFRHPEHSGLRDLSQEDPLEVQASQLGVRNYVKMEGDIGCMVNGAGLAMAVMDLVRLAGGRPANFLDIGTLNNPDRVVNAFRTLAEDPGIRAVLVNIFGGMARVDIIARGIVEARRQMAIRSPVVVRLAGTNVEEGERILSESGIEYIKASDLSEAALKVVEAAR